MYDAHRAIRPTHMTPFGYLGLIWIGIYHRKNELRVRTVAKRHVRSSMFTASFYSGFMCRTTVIFQITKDGSLVLNPLASWNCFTCRNLFQNGANDKSEWLTCETAFCKKKFKVLYSSDHPILIQFRQLVVNIVIKELQMVFLTSTVVNSNGNMKSWNSKLSVKSWCFDRVFHIAVANADIISLKCHL